MRAAPAAQAAEPAGRGESGLPAGASAGSSAAGSHSRIVVPLPGALSTSSSPPWLLAMRRTRLHFAVVLDAGRLAGIATLEDVLESLVGDIRDESDVA